MGIHKFFLIGAISIVGILAAKAAYATDFTGYTCDVNHMDSSERAASGIFLDLKKIRIFVNVGPLDELKNPDFPKSLTAVVLGEAIRKRAIESFGKCLKNPDKANELVQVVTDPKDPVFEESGTLGIYMKLQVKRASRASMDANTFDSTETEKIVLYRVDYYRPSEDKFSYIKNSPGGGFLIKYDNEDLEKRIFRIAESIMLY